MENKLVIIAVVLAVVVASVLGVLGVLVTKSGQLLLACATEAKLCPDGSYVGHTGPNCAFAPCPGSNKEVIIENDQPVACTMDAKLCPDGSYVGRTSPSCAFAPCPGSTYLPSDGGLRRLQ